tara:strand:+ start:405 stop:704 length:300 start_codon:yes stop_codon:yes gene_type:complete
MCYYCHINLKNNDLLEFLTNTTESEWIILNLTGICYLILCITGYNGLEVKNKAKNILNKYNKYYNIYYYDNIIKELKNNNIKEGNKVELYKFCKEFNIY